MKLEITLSNGSRYTSQTPAPHYSGYRALYDCEGGRLAPTTPNPRVVPSLNYAGVDFTEAMQLLSWELMQRTNPSITKKQWRAVYAGGRAFTNQNGFDMVDRNGNPLPPRADFVNRLDTTADLPRLMKGIICQGNFYHGEMVSGDFVITPGRGAIDTTKALPDVQTVLNNNWYFAATTGAAGSYSNFPQGGGGPVAIPLFLSSAANYTGAWFASWNSDVLPNVLKPGGK